MLSSLFNLKTFIGKRLFADGIRFLTKFFRPNHMHDTNLTPLNQNSENTYRCGTIYKRPWVKWNKIDANQRHDSLMHEREQYTC